MDTADVALKNLDLSWPSDWVVVSDSHLRVTSRLHGKTVVFVSPSARKIEVDSHVHAHVLEVVSQTSNLEKFQTDLCLEPFSNIQHVRLQIQPRGAQHVSSLSVIQQESSVLNSVSLNVGADAAHLITEIQQTGPYAESNVLGLFLSKDGQNIENSVTVNHDQPHGQSHQKFKGLVAEGARARFFGKIRIAKNAQKVDSRQSSATLICGRRADMQTQPELEILADDVKAAHGASIGQMSAEEIFYLRSRGLDTQQAVRLIARGFMDEIIMQIQGSEMRRFVVENLNASIHAFEDHFVRSMERA